MQVLLTGARTATLLQRLPFLPAADAYVAENGGRIFYPDQTLPTAMPLAEDSKWRKVHNSAGEDPSLPSLCQYLDQSCLDRCSSHPDQHAHSLESAPAPAVCHTPWVSRAGSMAG